MSGAHPPRAVRLLIVGAGFSGIGLAIRLRQRGIADFAILERASALGGTWRDNAYPGCACDVQSTLYSFSFAPNPGWSRTYSPQREIWDCLRDVAQRHDVVRHMAFGEEVTSASWDDAAQRWMVRSTTGTWRASMLVLANGPLSDPALPDIDGLADFGGTLFHSSRWDHHHALQGRRVAVIGTGASAIQFVPRIQPVVAQLDLYQRTPPWIMPRHDRAVPGWRRALYRALPVTQHLERRALYVQREALFLPFRHPRIARVVEAVARRHMHAQVRDPALRAKLAPPFTIGCKRILLSDDYYPALTQPNVEVISTRIARVTRDGVETTDGRTRPVDTIILGTGFRATDPPLANVVRGRDSRTLADVWQGSPSAYMGTTVAGFPNLFFLLGPNTGLGHSSVMLMAEAQFEHIVGLLSLAVDRGASSVEPRAEAQRRYVAWIDEALRPTVWNSGGCNSWYLDRNGRNSALWPFGIGRFRRVVTQVRPEDYTFTPAQGSADARGIA